MAWNVIVDDDTFVDLCLRRVREFEPAERYPIDEFWASALRYLVSECPEYVASNGDSDPMVVVDNIAVNGEIKTLDELYGEGYVNGFLDKDGVDSVAEANGWPKFGDHYVIRWGF